MIQTAATTHTQVGLRLELVSLELQSLNARSLNDPSLNEIIAYCVPRRYLQKFTIWGKEGGDVHMRLDVEIDYDEHDRQITLSGDGLPEGMAGRYSVACGRRDGNGQEAGELDHCPYTGKALDLYMNILKEKGLNVHWTVRFREKRQEMCAKFDLVPAIIHDCTRDGIANTVTNSRFPEIGLTARASTQAVPHG